MNLFFGGDSMQNRRGIDNINSFFIWSYVLLVGMIFLISVLRTSKSIDLSASSISLILLLISSLLLSIVFSFNWSFFDFEYLLMKNEKLSIPSISLLFFVNSFLLSQTWIFTRDSYDSIIEGITREFLVLSQFFLSCFFGGLVIAWAVRKFTSETEEIGLVNAEKSELITERELIKVFSIGTSANYNISVTDIVRIFDETLDSSIASAMEEYSFSKPPFNFNSYSEKILEKNLMLLLEKLAIDYEYLDDFPSLLRQYKSFSAPRQFQRKILTTTVDKICDRISTKIEKENVVDFRLVYHALVLIEITSSRYSGLDQRSLTTISEQKNIRFLDIITNLDDDFSRSYEYPSEELVEVVSILLASYSRFVHTLPFISPSDYVYEELLSSVVSDLKTLLPPNDSGFRYRRSSENYVTQYYNKIEEQKMEKHGSDLAGILYKHIEYRFKSISKFVFVSPEKKGEREKIDLSELSSYFLGDD